MRYFFEIAYNGANYHGWQIQKNAKSIQEVITDHLRTKLREDIDIVGSGRTDKGVHAFQQYFHTDIIKSIDPDDFKLDMNGFLPPDIVIRRIRKVSDKAHARFDAVRRSYKYELITSRDPFKHHYAYYFFGDLDLNLLNKASKHLLGIQNFESFSKVKTKVDNFNCEIFDANWKMENNSITFSISANRFLRGMVRAIVGTLLEIGLGKISPSQIKKIIELKDRKEAGQSVPAKGLYLTEVTYPESIFEE